MGDAVTTLRERFTETGLPFPSRLPDVAGQARLAGDWHLTTRSDGPPPYFVDEHVAEFERGDAADYVVLAHAGRGVNSWAVSYLVVEGPVGVFVQSAWGGLDEDDAGRVKAMADRFTLVDHLLAASVQGLDPGERLAVVDSDFGNRGWSVLRPGAPTEWIRSERPIEDALAHVLGGASAGKGSAGTSPVGVVEE